jgi:hypothetical protein
VAYPPGVPAYPPAVPAYPVAGPVYPPYAYLQVYEPLPRTSPLAMASLWCGIGGIAFGLTSIPAIILGLMAIRQMRRSGESGLAAATAGVVLGWVGVLFLVLIIAHF